MSCTSCGNKPGCDHRKTGMLSAMDQALRRLYPSRRWGERDDAGAEGVPPALSARLADRLARRLGAMTLFRPGGPEEYCDFVYVLCLGRQPSIVEVREGAARPHVDMESDTVDEVYLRIALSSLAPFAAVQQVAMRMLPVAGDVVVTEAPRTGVFDAILLARYQKLVAVLGELDIRNIDFGDMTLAPEGFDGSTYTERYGSAPMTANYLFYPQPCSSVTTTILDRRPQDIRYPGGKAFQEDFTWLTAQK